VSTFVPVAGLVFATIVSAILLCAPSVSAIACALGTQAAFVGLCRNAGPTCALFSVFHHAGAA
jgi:hypothetical protein